MEKIRSEEIKINAVLSDSLAYGNIMRSGLKRPVVIDEDKVYMLTRLGNAEFVWDDGDGNYIYAYTLVGGTVSLKGIYSILHHKLIDTANYRVHSAFVNMFLGGFTFDLIYPLSEVNKRDLEILTADQRKEYCDYLTSGNGTISHDEIVNYILSNIPVLGKYTDLNPEMTAKTYFKIVDECEKTCGWYNNIKAMPQDLDFIEQEYNSVSNPECRSIYLQGYEEDTRVFRLDKRELKRVRKKFEGMHR